MEIEWPYIMLGIQVKMLITTMWCCTRRHYQGPSKIQITIETRGHITLITRIQHTFLCESETDGAT